MRSQKHRLKETGSSRCARNYRISSSCEARPENLSRESPQPCRSQLINIIPMFVDVAGSGLRPVSAWWFSDNYFNGILIQAPRGGRVNYHLRAYLISNCLGTPAECKESCKSLTSNLPMSWRRRNTFSDAGEKGTKKREKRFIDISTLKCFPFIGKTTWIRLGMEMLAPDRHRLRSAQERFKNKLKSFSF